MGKGSGRRPLLISEQEAQDNWDKIFKVLREELLCDPEHLAPLCKTCHDDLDEHVHLKKETEHE